MRLRLLVGSHYIRIKVHVVVVSDSGSSSTFCKVDICVISGSGLGRMMSVEFAKLGSTLILWDVNTQGNEGTAELVREKGADVYTYTVDLSERSAIYEAAAKVS